MALNFGANEIAVFLGAVVGAAGVVTASLIGWQRSRLRKDLKRTAEQVQAYWRLEQIYIERIAVLEGEARHPSTIQKEARKLVQSRTNIYPKMTEQQAREIIEKY